MSGGHWNYKDGDLKDEIFGYSEDYSEERTTNPLEDLELSELVWDVFNLLHAYDWYVSGDSNKDKWAIAKAKFKSKWLSNNQNERLEQLIDSRLVQIRAEFMDMLHDKKI